MNGMSDREGGGEAASSAARFMLLTSAIHIAPCKTN
jgi:hypothetical protein